MIYADDVSKDVIYILNCIDGLHFLFSWLWILLNETFGAKKCTPDAYFSTTVFAMGEAFGVKIYFPL